jgi:lysozyme
MMPDTTKTRYDLVRDEGMRLRAYLDTTGNWSIGAGHKIIPGDGLSKDSTIGAAYAMTLLDRDIEKHWADLIAFAPWIADLDEVRQRALLNIAFNLGISKLEKFAPTLAHAYQRDWPAVVAHLQHTKWCRDVGDGPGERFDRADRIEQMLLTGADSDS